MPSICGVNENSYKTIVIFFHYCYYYAHLIVEFEKNLGSVKKTCHECRPFLPDLFTTYSQTHIIKIYTLGLKSYRKLVQSVFTRHFSAVEKKLN